MNRERSLFCFGLGYSAQYVARRALALGWRVGGTCRTPEKAARLAAEGIAAFVFDGHQSSDQIADALREATHVLLSVPPLESGDPVMPHHGEDLAVVAGNLRWLGYLSTTGVYGDCGGEWIDETQVPQPATPDNWRRLDAEHAWRDFAARHGIALHLFRLPGIYGPAGRNVIDALRAGQARRIVKPGQVFNRIHVEDLARVLLASMERPDTGPSLYNVADDEPAPADEVLAFAAQLIGVPLPPAELFAQAQLSPMARHFYEECKRVRNERIKRALDVTLVYPTYREGLRAIAAGR